MALLAALPAWAADGDPAYVTERGHLMCTRLDRFNDAHEAVSKHDQSWLESIKECSQSKGGLKAEMLQDGPLTAKIKVYEENGQSTVYWTSPTTLKEVRR
ncbi:MAG: hypothetical protein WDO24_17670 [Pseudomonadota bacterium]